LSRAWCHPNASGCAAGVAAILVSSVLFSVMAILVRQARQVDFFTWER